MYYYYLLLLLLSLLLVVVQREVAQTNATVQRLKVIIDCPQPGSSWATYRPPPISRWSKCGGNDTVMVLLGSGMSKVPKETQPE